MMLVACQIFPGGFSGEFTFKIKLDDGTEHIGLAARQYFWSKDGKSLTQPPVTGIEGFVTVRILDRNPDPESTLVSIPDGEVIKIKNSRIIMIPLAEPLPHVPIGS